MTFVEAEQALKIRLSSVVGDWPVRWANDVWANGVPLSDGNMPLDPNTGAPAYALEAEIPPGAVELRAIGNNAAGKRTFCATGLFRVYLSGPVGVGSTPVLSKRDEIAAHFTRAVLIADNATGQRLVMDDPNPCEVYYEDGNRFSMGLSIPFEYFYRG